MQVSVNVQMEFSTWYKELIHNDDFDFYCDALEQFYGNASLIHILEVKTNKKGEGFYPICRITIAHPAYEHYHINAINTNENWKSNPVSILAAHAISVDIQRIDRITQLPGKQHKICLIERRTEWNKLTLGEVKFAFLYMNLKAETEKIHSNIRTQLYSSEFSQTVRYWISEMQLSLLNDAMDLLNTQREGVPKLTHFLTENYATREFEALTLYFLNLTILNIKRKYGHHFSDEVNEYMRNYHISTGELQSRIQTLKVQIATLADEELKHIINSQIQLIETGNGVYTSLHEYTYAKFLVYELTTTLQSSNSNTLESEIISEKLLLLNFNHTSFIAWRVKKLRDEMKNLNNQLELRQWLLREHKKIKQQIPLTKIAFRPNFPSASELLSKWINEELAYMDGIHASNPEETIPFPQNNGNQKLTTSLNVPQLALFAALMAEEGVIENKNKTQVFTTFSNTFRTVNQENIAVTSLRNNYYDKDPKNIEVLKTKLIQMINRLNRNLNSNETF